MQRRDHLTVVPPSVLQTNVSDVQQGVAIVGAESVARVAGNGGQVSLPGDEGCGVAHAATGQRHIAT